MGIRVRAASREGRRRAREEEGSGTQTPVRQVDPCIVGLPRALAARRGSLLHGREDELSRGKRDASVTPVATSGRPLSAGLPRNYGSGLSAGVATSRVARRAARAVPSLSASAGNVRQAFRRVPPRTRVLLSRSSSLFRRFLLSSPFLSLSVPRRRTHENLDGRVRRRDGEADVQGRTRVEVEVVDRAS